METFSALLALCAGNSPVPVNSPHKGQWRGALMFSLINAWINDWVNNREAGDLRCQRGHYDVIVMQLEHVWISVSCSLCIYNYLSKLFMNIHMKNIVKYQEISGSLYLNHNICYIPIEWSPSCAAWLFTRHCYVWASCKLGQECNRVDLSLATSSL